MKKILISAAAILLIIALFASCRTRERCPAYSKAEPASTEKHA